MMAERRSSLDSLATAFIMPPGVVLRNVSVYSLTGRVKEAWTNLIGPGPQTPFGNPFLETLFPEWSHEPRNRVSQSGFPNRVWEPGKEEFVYRGAEKPTTDYPRAASGVRLSE